MASDLALGRRSFLLLGGASVLSGCSASASSARPSPASVPPGRAGRSRAAAAAPGTVSIIATGLAVPWGLGFLPDGDAVASERETGRVLRIPARGGSPEPLLTLPALVPAGLAPRLFADVGQL